MPLQSIRVHCPRRRAAAALVACFALAACAYLAFVAIIRIITLD